MVVDTRLLTESDTGMAIVAARSPAGVQRYRFGHFHRRR
jgi:hypothetical protein